VLALAWNVEVYRASLRARISSVNRAKEERVHGVNAAVLGQRWKSRRKTCGWSSPNGSASWPFFNGQIQQRDCAAIYCFSGAWTNRPV